MRLDEMSYWILSGYMLLALFSKTTTKKNTKNNAYTIIYIQLK